MFFNILSIGSDFCLGMGDFFLDKFLVIRYYYKHKGHTNKKEKLKMKKKDFSIKSWKFTLAWVVLVGGALFGATFVTINNNLDIKAVQGEEISDVEYPSGVIFDEYEKEIETYVPTAVRYGRKRSDNAMGGDEGLVTQATEESFDTRRNIRTVRVKNQGGEGLCWAYSTTTAIEYLLAKNGIRVEFSPKVMDYRFVSAEDAYTEGDKSNAYYDAWYNSYSKYARNLGTGAADSMMMLVFSDPLALVHESNFVDIIRKNDSRLVDLGITNSYDELWSKNYGSVTTTTSYGTVYDKKQSFSKINDTKNTDYVVTGLEYVRFPYYELTEAPNNSQIKRSDVIQDIKNMIKANGAVNASISTDSGAERECSYLTDSVRVFISKGQDVCSGAHAITLVGWDDNFSYQDGNKTKTGVFIVQNSWGSSGIENYMSYDSELYIRSYYDWEEYDSYDNIYSLVDYQEQTETPQMTEHIFEFKSDKKERLKAFAFTEYPSSKGYDVMISSKNTNYEYQKVNGEGESFSTRVGINKYVFKNEVVVEGDYKIKLVRTSSYGVNYGKSVMNNMIVFTDDVYGLSFDVDGGSKMSEQYCEPGDNGKCEIYISNTVPNRDGYIFKGWAEKTGVAGVNYRPGDKVLMSGNKVLYAVWKKIATITFDKTSIVKHYGDDDFINDVTIDSDSDATYSIDNTAVATVNSDTGQVKIVGVGTATVTASVEEVDRYTEATGTYTLTVEKKVSARPEIEVKEGYVTDPLSTIEFDIDGLSWVDDTIAIEEGQHSYNAKYTENNDTKHYTTEEIQITVNGIRRTYEVIDGDEQVYVLDSGEYAEFSFDVDYSLFAGGSVYIDGVVLDPQYYVAKPGSVIIDISDDYLQTLSVGEHTISVYFDDGGVASANFTIKEKEELPVPDTDFDDTDDTDDTDGTDNTDDTDGDGGSHNGSEGSKDDTNDSDDSRESIAVPDTGVMGGGSDAAGGITVAVGLLAIGAMGYAVVRNRKSIFHKVGFDKSK